jgi:type I restriction enzyme S subunit
VIVVQEKEVQRPSGWEWVSIGDTGEYINGFAFKPSHREPTGLPIVRIQNLTNETKPLNTTNHNLPANYKIDNGDMLVSWSATLDVFVWRRGPALVNQHIFKVVPNENVMSKKLLFYWLKRAIQQLQETEHLHGSTMMHINRGPFMAHPVPMPPAAEQSRIVAKLEELLSDLDAGEAELLAAQKKLTRYRHSLLKAAVEGMLTAEWRTQNIPAETGEQLLERILMERRASWEAKQNAKFREEGKTPPKDWQTKYPEPVRPLTGDLPELPKGWVWASVDQCSLDDTGITDGPFGSNLKSEHYQDVGPRVIRLQNIGEGVFFDAKAHISTSHYNELKKHAVEEGDLLVAMLGEVLPRACIVPMGISPAIVKADCARVRLNTHLALPSVLMAQLNSKPIRDFVLKFVKGIGRPRINLGHIRAIPVALCSLEEQRQIESSLTDAQTSIDEQLNAIQLGLKQTAAQHQNILRTAFSGLLVPQDPTDEPASALLERIRNTRAEPAKKPNFRKTKQQKEITAVVSKLIDVLAEAGDWVPAQEAFRRCGVVDGTLTDQIETLYAELRALDKAGRLAVEAVTDTQGRKLHDRLKLLAGSLCG